MRILEKSLNEELTPKDFNSHKRKIMDIYGIYAIIIGVTTSIEALIFASSALGGNIMNYNLAALCSILAALIGAITTIIIAIIQAKKHGSLVINVKEDTGTMRPKIDNIDKNTEKIKDKVIETIVPQIDQLSKTSEKIDFIENDVRYRQRLQSDVSINLTNKDYLIGGIESVYERNGTLENENRVLKRKLFDAQEEIERLKKKNQDLLMTNKELAKDIRQFSQDVEIENIDLEL